MNLVEELRRTYSTLQQEMLRKFKRRVPLGDLLFDRWEIAQQYGFGEGTSCYDNVLIIGDVTVGKQCWIGPNVLLDGFGGLSIGDHVHICAGVQIYSHHTINKVLSGGETDMDRERTSIGSRVYLGPNVVIQKGLSIGNDVIIGALSLVLSDIPSGCRAWGVPARVLDSDGISI